MNPSKTPLRPLVRRRRNSARLALYVSLAVVGLVLVAILAWMRPRFDFGMSTGWAQVHWEDYPEVRLLQEYVRINTAAAPEGDPREGARWLARQLAAMGLLPVVEEVGDEANVWAVLEGEERGAIVLHSHIDVDPALHPEEWEHPPFSGVIEGPWLWGRGAFDMKSVTIAQLDALRRLTAKGLRPRKSVIFLATSGEETGSDLGTKWILRNHPELVERFEVVLTEGGAVEGRSLDELKFWGTEFVQKRLVDFTLCGPEGALQPLVDELQGRGLIAGEPKLVPEVELFFEVYAPTRDAERLQELLLQPRELLRDRGTFESLSRYNKSFFRNELFPRGFVEVDGGWELRLRAVLLPGEDPEKALDELLPPWRRHGLAMVIHDEGASPHGSPVDHWAFEAIDEVMEEVRPDVVHGPLVLPLTVTDARFFRDAGVTTYGFSPFGILTPQVVQLRWFGTINERISLIGYVEGVELYGDVLERLAANPSGP